ncbi:MAG: hypothetical protein ACR2FO_02725 [Actinomycetota bacterium]
MRKVLAASFAVLALLASGCTPKESTTPAPSATTDEGSETFTVDVDGTSDKFALATLSFFPNELSVHPGDTVDFKEIFTGEPHTAALGTTIDAAMAAFDKLTPEQKEAEDTPPPPEFLKVPFVFPDDEASGPPAEGPPGPPALEQSAAQPCFLDTGDPPVSKNGSAPACPKREQPEFNGTQTLFSSGYLAEDDNFPVKFASDTKPGTYNVMCLVHGPDMTAKITVADKGTKIATPDEVADKGKEQVEKLVADLSPDVEKAKSATADKAVAGTGSEKVRGAFVAEFLPKEVSVKVGEAVSWTTFHFHTISFNAPQDAIGGALIKDSDGTVKIAVKAGETTKGAPEIPPDVGGGEAKKPTTLQATYDGSGFFNSGIFGSFPPNQVTYKVKFTKAGTYDLQCLVHPDMKGKVTVG